MDAEKVRRGDRLAAIAEGCRRLHGGRRFLKDFDMFEIQPRYLAIVRERGFRLPDRYEEFEPQIRELERAMRVGSEQTVPCNNDLLAENLIEVGGEMRLIDYEYSGNNDPCFELGNIWAECGLSIDQLDELVTAYYGRRLRHKTARSHLQGIVGRYGWTLWGCIQSATSTIDFDFWNWGMARFEAAVADLKSPHITRLLEEAHAED